MYPSRCPKCDDDFTGKPIPEESRDAYGGATNFSRVIGISSLEHDRLVAWKCPDCGHEWPR